MEIRHNPLVTQLAIARPNPYTPHKSSPISKETDMLRKKARRNGLVANANVSSSVTSAEAMQRRRNLQAAISQIDSNIQSVRSSRRSVGSGIGENDDAIANPRSKSRKTTAKSKPVVAKKTVASKKTTTKTTAKRKNPGPLDTRYLYDDDVRSNPPTRRGASIATATAAPRRRAKAPTRSFGERGLKDTLPTMGSLEGKKIDTSKIKDVVKQIRILQKQYDVSRSPATKKRLDRAIATLDQMQRAIERDMKRLDEIAVVLNENPKKGGRMAKRSTSKRTASKKKVASASSLYKKLAAKSSKKKPAKARKNAAPLAISVAGRVATKKRKAKKTTARKNGPIARGITAGEIGVENPKKRRSAKKVSAKKVTSRKATTRRRSRKNPNLTIGVAGRANPMKRVVSTALKNVSPDSVTLIRKGKAITLKAKRTSSEFKAAKSKGLVGRYSKLSGKKHTPTSLNVRSVHSMVGSNPSAAEIQKALNAWAGAVEGGHLTRSNPKKRRSVKLTATTKRRKASAVKVKRAKRKSRRNPVDIAVGRENPKRRKKSVKAQAKKAHTKRRSSKVARKSTRKGARRNPVESLILNPGHHMFHNPAMMGIHNPEIGIGAKLGYGTLGAAGFLFLGNMAGGLSQKLIDKANLEEGSKKPMIVDASAHLALGLGMAALYHYSSKSEEIKSFTVGSALGLVGSFVARNYAQKWIANSFLGGAFRLTGGEGEFVADAPATSGYVPYSPAISAPPVGKYAYVGQESAGAYGTGISAIPAAPRKQLGMFISESPLQTLEGWGGMGKYVETAPTREEAHELKDLANESGMHGMKHLSNYIETPRQMGNISAGLMNDAVLSAQTAPQDKSRVGGAGFEISTLAKELRDVEALSADEMRAEGVPYVDVENVAVIRATPYYARQIAESNLGYIIKASDAVQNAYIVGLFVGPNSMFYNTGIGVRDLSIPHGVRSARPAGIFTHTVFSSVMPTADGQPIWSGGDDGDF